jgi:UDP-N-acetylglucosamine--N-acetylmuramyl-(pentapeptide) pyrophosphoryl-undecaprenol N-acetylglucosamine transferase
MNNRPVVLAAGGTGGHMFPLLAVAEALAARGQPVHVLTDTRGARFLPDGLPKDLVSAESPSGPLRARALAMVALAHGTTQSLRIFRRHRPAALGAFGGYACFPPAAAGALTRVPILLHEQNAVLGKANRWLAGRAARVALAFDATRNAGGIAQDRRLLVGNPVRAAVAALPAAGYEAPAEGDELRVLVLGGSQGARVLSDVVPQAIGRLPAPLRDRLRLTQQCRPEDLKRVRETYAEMGQAVELAAFFPDAPQRLADAHLFVGRSGASTIAELLHLGRPSLLIPYRWAADDHQDENARTIAAAGAAEVVGEVEADAGRLADLLAGLLAHPVRLAAMAAAAARLARPDAADRLAAELMRLATQPVPARPALREIA